MRAVIVCEKTGWTYDEYLDQPQWMTDLLFEKWRVDNDRQEAVNYKHHGI